MSTLYLIPASTTTGPKTASEPRTLRTAAVLTTSYVASTNVVVALGWDYVVVGIDFTKGQSTTIEIKPEVSDGTTWRTVGYKADQSSSVSQILPDILQMTVASFASGATSFTIGPIDVRGCQLFRVSAKATGGTQDDTIGFTVTGGISPAGSRAL